ncbi:MAG: hypothetical protein M1819_007156 [Sarea resinae]|nr:MAG: hypothetical protein M1819_007156 [Sarea resinae]
MFARCEGPIWRHDDFTNCFQRDFLQVLLPLIISGTSILFLSFQIIQQIRQSQKSSYKSLASTDNVFGIPGDSDARNGLSNHDDDTESEDEDLDLHLAPTKTHESVLAVDRPKGEILVVIIEELAVLGEVGISAAAFQWLFLVILFRSAIIHPRSKLAQGLMISDFALATLLTLISLNSRKGNKAVVLEYEDDLEPSREPLASVLSLASFSWVDSIVWKGYRKTLELSDVWNLLAKDKAAAVLANYRQVRKTSGLAWHMVKYFRRGLIIQAAWAFISGLNTFVPTLLLKAVLEYVENPEDTPMNAAWLYVILLFVSGCVAAISSGQALWIGRKICIRSRAVIIGEIYAKAIKRKAAAGSDTILGDETNQEPKQGIVKRILSFGRKKTQENNANLSAPQAKDTSDQQVNVGTIINLMAVDSFKISELSAYLHYLTAATPVQVVLAISLLYRLLGYSSIAGIGTMLVLLPVNIVVAKQFSKAQKTIMAATDTRIHTTNEVLQNIRIIKFFAWEERFGHIVNESRARELKALRYRYILWAVAATIWSGAPVLITFLSFAVYTLVEKKDLIPSVAFTALSLFTLLRVPLDQLADMLAHIQEAKVSVDRVEEFLSEEETGKYSQLQHERFDEDGQPIIGFEHATFTWGSKEAAGMDLSKAFRLIEMNIKFEVGQLNVITGPTGSGKTSLLMALLGEMTLLEGSVYLPGGHSREDLHVDRETGLTESVAYCSQQAWLVNDTIKENIIFASPWDERRYKTVLVACALEKDLQILDNGDETLVGEKGITLSGGQKQRISLARALYCNSRHVLLDDCLSAVDSHTAKWIFDHCIMGPLMYNRTCVLVTHNVALCVPKSKMVVILANGRIASQGSPEEVIESGLLGEEMSRSRPASKPASTMPSRVPSDVGGEEALGEGEHANGTNGTIDNGLNGKASKPKEPANGPGNANLRTEGKAEGGVKLQIIHLYLAAMGSWPFWTAALVVFAGQQISSVATNVWIRNWANAYHYHAIATTGVTGTSAEPPVQNYVHTGRDALYGNCFTRGTCGWDMLFSTKQTPKGFSTASSAEVNVPYYLGIYAFLGFAFMVITFVREGVLFGGSLSASWKIHQRLLESVTRAKLRFFDSTPLGQIMNRFSRDIEAVDQEVAPVAVGMLHCLASVITIVILISVITPGFLIAGVFISAMYFFIGQFYINTSRDLKRLESVQRSPLYQHFGETLTGTTTIRAYADEKRFVRDNLSRVNTHNRPFIYLWAANRWLSFRVDVTGALVSFFAGTFVILSTGKIDAGAAGLSLTYAVTFTENVLWLVRLYANNEQNMNSVERIKEYLDVEQESAPVIPDMRPPANWPSQGSVQFINYTTRYREDFDPVLRNVSFHISPGQKVGIVGRTGAGKSSLALALFRGLEAEEGKILIDDVDIGLIGLRDLRESITIVPQGKALTKDHKQHATNAHIDPTLFTGTIRSNLDPFGVFTDEEIFNALRRVHLIDPSTAASTSATPTPSGTPSIPNGANGTSTPTHSDNKNIFLDLTSHVTESGSNLSQGQRQLLCLARALLKSPNVLLMDEATASIDYATDAKIQETIRELRSTIITIAHRLQTIIDYDKVLVLDKGRVVEYDDPWHLVRKDGGAFKGMCEMSGDLESLEREAKKAYEAKRLVDDT